MQSVEASQSLKKHFISVWFPRPEFTIRTPIIGIEGSQAKVARMKPQTRTWLSVQLWLAKITIC